MFDYFHVSLYPLGMKRDRYSDLLAWKNLPARKPLILRGARQVGKTYLLKEFGRREYKNISPSNLCGRVSYQGKSYNLTHPVHASFSVILTILQIWSFEANGRRQLRCEAQRSNVNCTPVLDRKALDICVSQFVDAESDQFLPNPHTLLAHLPLHFCSWRRRSNGAI